jgi:hypothetical protein
MEKPKYHPEAPRSTKLIKLQNDSLEYKMISKLIEHTDFEIESISRIVSQLQWSKYKNQKLKLQQRIGKKPSEKIFYHLTKCSSAKKIVVNGFNVHNSRLHAFGKGINQCPNFKDVLKYHKMYSDNKNRSALFVTQSLIGKAHSNSSDDQVIVKNTDGSYYTKPQFMVPRKGFDSMYSKSPYKEIWVIPSAQRIYSLYLIILKSIS